MTWTSSTMRIAWRNLWRNRRRTALALSAIGLSVMLVLAYTSILRAYGEWIVETITGPMLGHVQAHAPQWRKDRLIDRTLRGVDAQLAELRRDPDVASATARILSGRPSRRSSAVARMIAVRLSMPSPRRQLRRRGASRTAGSSPIAVCVSALSRSAQSRRHRLR